MADETPQRKQINFTIIPDDQPGDPRTYANFCSIAHTPFDFTLTFCEVMPLSERELREAESDHVVRAPVRARVVVPVQFVPNLVAALQEHMRALTALPGVGRKTANVVLGHALGVPGLPVDRHVLRVSNRIGIAESDDPVKVEEQLCKALPKEMWTLASDVQILHGRRVCKPKPLCDQCSVRDDCDYFRLVVSREQRRGGPSGDRRGGPSGERRGGPSGPPKRKKNDARKVRTTRR